MNEQALLNFSDEESGGYRLARFEMLNWGTFNGGVRVIELDGKNGLLTGEIGSGKSTVVDAITTLLIPPTKLAYNKAAGAENKERTLKSYVEGYYKSERSAESAAARPVALRGPGSYSVLLACFHNDSMGADLTLASIFWIDETHVQPERFYAAAEKRLSIVEHFSSFGRDMKGLRKKLRGAGAEIFENYPSYRGYFSRILGIRSDQALNLFNQTVSMKSIGDLTGFMRSHMLERSDVADKIKNLIGHFDDLTGAHEAVLRAKDQVAMLLPIETDSVEFNGKSRESAELESASQALECWAAGYKCRFYEDRLLGYKESAVALAAKMEKLDEEKDRLEESCLELRTAIGSDENGRRINEIEREIRRTRDDMLIRKRNSADYKKWADALALPACDSAELFASNAAKMPALIEKFETEAAELDNRRSEKLVARKELSTRAEALADELQSLRGRRSNIDANCVALRARIAAALSIGEEELPFAGELIEVRKEESAWEGAAERLLHSFGLSVLVPEKRYAAVSDWADKNDLRGRLVYYRVKERTAPPVRAGKDSLLSKLAVKEDSPLYGWLSAEMSGRFDLVCCQTMEQFRREPRAITLHGQIKSGDKRHEKDDRHRLTDRSRYILGWSNKAKIEALEREAAQLAKELAKLESELKTLAAARGKAEAKTAAAKRIAECRSFAELDWLSASKAIEALSSEQKALENASKKLDSLKKQLEAAKAQLKKVDSERMKTGGDRSSLEDKERETAASLAANRLLITETELAACSPSFPRLEAARAAAAPGSLSLDNIDKAKSDMAKRINGEKKSADAIVASAMSRIVKAMTEFKGKYPIETQDFGADPASLTEYLHLLEQLRRDDLPRFEKKFRELLHEKTMQEIASFHENLYSTGRDIEARIKIINEALELIDYAPGRCIVLEAEPGADITIREFKQELRECTTDALSGDEGTSAEKRFEAIERIIARFKGRKDFADADKRWTEKVTDVRNWYTFAASERYREDGTEYEHYSDTSGKSGGQKEKLAYTILAASLAYQFGLNAGGSRARTFRFVMIDEAFGRGSDESARFALELFRTLNLQLLIVTPLQKIHVIEPYVSHVAFISNKDGKSSAISSLTIEEYKEKADARLDK